MQPFAKGLNSKFLVKLRDLCKAFFPGARFIKRKRIGFDKIQVDSVEHEGLTGYNISEAVHKLKKVTPLDNFGIVGVTMEHLWYDDQERYISGLANLLNRRGIFTFSRCDPAFYEVHEDNNEEVMLHRAAKVLIHELGHMFGMRHCIYYE